MSRTTLSAAKSPNVTAQAAFVAGLKERGFKFGLTVGDAFVRGIRDLGYKSNANALCELIDNSTQAGAGRVDVSFGYGGKSDKKPTALAVIDDGHGMEADMIRLSVMWGGTHREGDRSGMGRYGYGLPCSSVSIGRRFTVYSKVAGGALHSVTVDLDDIGEGRNTDASGDIVVPEAEAAKLPTFVEAAVKAAHPEGWASGTVIVIEKLDRIDWTTANGLRENLLRNFGVTYHKLRDRIAIHVDGVYCEPIDPLFLTPGFRFYDLEGDADRALAFEPAVIEVKDQKTRETIGRMVVRFAYFPPSFGSLDKRKTAKATSKNANPRFAVMKDYHGVLFSRMGRLIDVEVRTPWTVFVNNDRYIKVEVEFDAALDEWFGITTSKQQVTVTDRVWDILKQHSVPKAIEQMRAKVRDLKQRREVEGDRPAAGEARPAEEAMAEAKASLRAPVAEIRARQEAHGEDRLNALARDRSDRSGRSEEEEQRDLLVELDGRDFKVEIEALPGAPFFRCDFLGTAKVLYINREHRFYRDLYAGPRSSPPVRWALELLLLAIADSMLDANDETARVYKVEVPQWSMKLDLGLERLSENVAIDDERDDEEPAWTADAGEVVEPA